MSIFDRFKKKDITDPQSPPALGAPGMSRMPDPAMVPGPGETMITFGGLNMHWAGCRASVEAELEEVSGALSVNVDLKGQAATVVFDPSRADVNALREAIERAGYKPQQESIVGPVRG